MAEFLGFFPAKVCPSCELNLCFFAKLHLPFQAAQRLCFLCVFCQQFLTGFSLIVDLRRQLCVLQHGQTGLGLQLLFVHLEKR